MLYFSHVCFQLREATACIILTNKQSSDPVDEDASAIMRVIAIKDFDPDIRIIVQLIQYQHKVSWIERFDRSVLIHR